MSSGSCSNSIRLSASASTRSALKATQQALPTRPAITRIDAFEIHFNLIDFNHMKQRKAQSLLN